MSHEDFSIERELDALRESLPSTAVEETAGDAGLPTKTADQYYSLTTAKKILDLYAQGKSLARIAREESEMPCYSTILRWAKNHPEFSKMLRSVRDARALHFEDAAIEAAENAQGKDADRLKFEAYKWGAEVNDPATYGKKVQATHDHGGRVTLQVVTGFGPPNRWQTPPKLKEDGTIDKEASAIPVENEASPAQEERPEINVSAIDTATSSPPEPALEVGREDAPCGDGSDLVHGPSALSAE